MAAPPNPTPANEGPIPFFSGDNDDSANWLTPAHVQQPLPTASHQHHPPPSSGAPPPPLTHHGATNPHQGYEQYPEGYDPYYTNPDASYSHDPNASYNYDPNAGYSLDPNANYSADPSSGYVHDPNAAAGYDYSTTQDPYYDPSAQHDPNAYYSEETAHPADPITAAVAGQEYQPYYDEYGGYYAEDGTYVPYDASQYEPYDPNTYDPAYYTAAADGTQTTEDPNAAAEGYIEGNHDPHVYQTTEDEYAYPSDLTAHVKTTTEVSAPPASIPAPAPVNPASFFDSLAVEPPTEPATSQLPTPTAPLAPTSTATTSSQPPPPPPATFNSPSAFDFFESFAAAETPPATAIIEETPASAPRPTGAVPPPPQLVSSPAQATGPAAQPVVVKSDSPVIPAVVATSEQQTTALTQAPPGSTMTSNAPAIPQVTLTNIHTPATETDPPADVPTAEISTNIVEAEGVFPVSLADNAELHTPLAPPTYQTSPVTHDDVLDELDDLVLTTRPMTEGPPPEAAEPAGPSSVPPPLPHIASTPPPAGYPPVSVSLIGPSIVRSASVPWSDAPAEEVGPPPKGRASSVGNIPHFKTDEVGLNSGLFAPSIVADTPTPVPAAETDDASFFHDLTGDEPSVQPVSSTPRVETTAPDATTTVCDAPGPTPGTLTSDVTDGLDQTFGAHPGTEVADASPNTTVAAEPAADYFPSQATTPGADLTAGVENPHPGYAESLAPSEYQVADANYDPYASTGHDYGTGEEGEYSDTVGSVPPAAEAEPDYAQAATPAVSAEYLVTSTMHPAYVDQHHDFYGQTAEVPETVAHAHAFSAAPPAEYSPAAAADPESGYADTLPPSDYQTADANYDPYGHGAPADYGTGEAGGYDYGYEYGATSEAGATYTENDGYAYDTGAPVHTQTADPAVTYDVAYSAALETPAEDYTYDAGNPAHSQPAEHERAYAATYSTAPEAHAMYDQAPIDPYAHAPMPGPVTGPADTYTYESQGYAPNYGADDGHATRAAPTAVAEHPIPATAPVDQRLQEDVYRRGQGFPVIAFGFGGQVWCTFPQRTQRYSTDTAYHSSYERHYPGQMEKRDLSAVFGPDPTLALDTYPGPLLLHDRSGAKQKKDGVLAYVQQRLDSLSMTPAAEASALIWRTLQGLGQHDGQLLEDPAAVQELCAALRATPSFAHGITAPTSAVEAELQALESCLLHGDRLGAVKRAVDRRLWAHALIIGSCVGKEVWRDVVQAYTQDVVKNSTAAGPTDETAPHAPSAGPMALRLIYQLFGGAQGSAPLTALWDPQPFPLTDNAAAPFMPATDFTATQPDDPQSLAKAEAKRRALALWPRLVAVVLANQTKGDAPTLTALGDELARTGNVAVAHLCYLLSPRTSSCAGAGAPHSRFTLLTATDATRYDPAALITTEIYEFVLSLRAGKVPAALPHLQPYKLLHAWWLVECGRVSEATRYCDALAGIVDDLARGSPFLTPGFVHQLTALKQRLDGFGATSEASGSNGVSSWLSRRLAKPSFTSLMSAFDSSLDKLITGTDGSTTASTAGDAPRPDEIRPEDPSRALSPPALVQASGSVSATGHGLRSEVLKAAPYSPGGLHMSNGPHRSRPNSALDTTHPPPPLSVSPLPATASPKTRHHSTGHVDTTASPYSPAGYLPTVSSPLVQPAAYSPVPAVAAVPSAYQQTHAPSPVPAPAPLFYRVDDAGAGEAVPAVNGDGFLNMAPPVPTFAAADFNYGNNAVATPVGGQGDSYPQDDLDDLGFGNSSLSKSRPHPEATSDPVHAAAPTKPQSAPNTPPKKATPTAQGSASGRSTPSGGGMFGFGMIKTLFGGQAKSAETGGTPAVKANLGEESSFVYDPALKRWVNKSASADDQVAQAAPPPPPPKATPISTPAPPAWGASNSGYGAPPSYAAPPSAPPGLPPMGGTMSQPPRGPGTPPLTSLPRGAMPAGMAPGGPPGLGLSKSALPAPTSRGRRGARSRYVDILNTNGS
ncbi:hypothetical protein IWQ60_004976 [Tieghemiomyces parasiticus]|uniref:Protein transport protein sec16 n=1 Tax=Tieghemiomyces parasiticus TaxID=78921 RepID=A0A9W8A759_9FUNG|nr:hypothetical protein IWQ60_004976 [Tieghemiomyces parasiticus]